MYPQSSINSSHSWENWTWKCRFCFCSGSFFLFSSLLSLLHNSKTMRHIWAIYTQNTLLSEILLFFVRAACELRLSSYGSKHMLQPLSRLKSYKDVLPFKRLLYHYGYFWLTGNMLAIETFRRVLLSFWFALQTLENICLYHDLNQAPHCHNSTYELTMALKWL